LYKGFHIWTKALHKDKSFFDQHQRNISSVDIFFNTNIRHGVIEKDFFMVTKAFKEIPVSKWSS